jgi:transcriptional regulator with GAF, ATPase, and Fis domain
VTSTPVEELAKTFVELADTTVGEFDLDDFLRLLAERSVRLLGVDAAGLLVPDVDGPHFVGASDEQDMLAEILRTQAETGGPSLECSRTGAPISVIDLSTVADQWPDFVAVTRDAGFAATHVLPLRLRADILGALTLFLHRPGTLDGRTTSVAQAMADIATISIVRERSVRQQARLAAQLQHALSSRVVIEQAKGMISERLGLRVEDAFAALRTFSRSNNRALSGTAAEIVDGSLDPNDLTKD